jgi:hypothetical protein
MTTTVIPIESGSSGRKTPARVVADRDPDASSLDMSATAATAHSRKAATQPTSMMLPVW